MGINCNHDGIGVLEGSVCFQESEAWIFAGSLRNTFWVLSVSSHAHFIYLSIYLIERETRGENLAFNQKRQRVVVNRESGWV